jgi:hypothetical protein
MVQPDNRAGRRPRALLPPEWFLSEIRLQLAEQIGAARAGGGKCESDSISLWPSGE